LFLTKNATVFDILFRLFLQRDFLEPGGFGEMLGNDITKLTKAIEPCKKVLAAARSAGLLVIHTREGHRPGLSDVHPHKKQRKGAKQVIGTQGPFGKILIRGEPGHDIIPELYPLDGEPIVDKPGKGSFYATDLEAILAAQGIQQLFVCGVTTEVCVHTTVREANDRGFHCIVVSDACASFFDDFHESALQMIVAQGGIFGSVTDSTKMEAALKSGGEEKKADE
jgi:nicotinamidase-related amidase